MPKFVFTVNATRHRKTGLVINSSSSEKLKASAEKEYSKINFVKLRIGRSEFPASVRKDGRIGIPASVIRNENLSSGKLVVRLVRTRKGEVFSSHVRYSTSRNNSRIRGEYYWIDYRDVSMTVLGTKILNRVYDLRKQASGFYAKLYFIIYKDDGNVLPLGFTSAFWSYDLLEDAPKQTADFIDEFVADSFFKVEQIASRPYVDHIDFIGYTVSNVVLIKERVRIRDI